VNRPVLRIRADEHVGSVVLLDLFERDMSTAIPVGVGDTPADAILDARATLLSALAVVDEVVEDLHEARARARRVILAVDR
jgi:hypothetical protein